MTGFAINGISDAQQASQVYDGQDTMDCQWNLGRSSKYPRD